MPRWRFFYHLVWAARGREPVLNPKMQEQLGEDLRHLAQEYGVIVHAIGGVSDHIHVAVSIPPSIPVATAVSRLKGGSSHRINQHQGGGFAWQPDYGVTTLAERHLNRVIAYIENQPTHHADGTLLASAELDSE